MWYLFHGSIGIYFTIHWKRLNQNPTGKSVNWKPIFFRQNTTFEHSSFSSCFEGMCHFLDVCAPQAVLLVGCFRFWLHNPCRRVSQGYHMSSLGCVAKASLSMYRNSRPNKEDPWGLVHIHANRVPFWLAVWRHFSRAKGRSNGKERHNFRQFHRARRVGPWNQPTSCP